jgi:NAD(P)-dependent dehydrogenase (short-subunit alcohol dehydrogenase family)
MTQDLKGKIAVVTGASRGIGRAIAEALARDGALVGVHYGRSRDAADDVVASIKRAGGEAFAVGADLTQPGAAAALFAGLDAELTKRTGSNRFDILVNNAGIAPFVGFAETTEAQFDEIYAVNVKAVYFITQEAVKRLNDGGRIISTSSIVARAPATFVPAYSALKAPIDNLTKALAIELGPRNITVNAVAPGVIETDMTEFVQTEDGANMALSKQALKRIGKPDDVADVVSFLAGPKSRWVTGEVIEVGGGGVLTF